MKRVLFLLIFCSLGMLSLSGPSKRSFSSLTNSSRAYVLFKQIPSSEQLARVLELKGVHDIGAFDSYPSDYFSRLFRIQIKSSVILDQVRNLSIVEDVFVPQRAYLSALFPAKQAKPLSSDLFFNYQWALNNIYHPGDEDVSSPSQAQGHIIKSDITDVVGEFRASRPIAGDFPYDIGWGETSQSIADSQGQPLIVAVLDSGIDFLHEDLEGSIHKKEIECDRGRIGRAEEDKDGNGLKGDCMGWDFSVPEDSRRANRPNDSLGHGTHVAGIIAAQRDNKLGISGVSNRLKIMPLKVIASTEDGDEEDEELAEEVIGFTDGIAKAIRYATHEGAKVINMSLGWPRVSNTPDVREAIKEAIEKGVVIIAAAGNNSNPSPIYPCAYDGVICVGSINNDGTVSDFSNFGGHVDVLAPGLDILSTYPTSVGTLFFNTTGYEVLRGTSQAAPYVAGLAGLMKLKTPEISIDEILARMSVTSRDVFRDDKRPEVIQDGRFVAGAVQFDDALTVRPQAFVRPELKGLDLISYKKSEKKAYLTIPVKAYWRSASRVALSIEVEKPSVRVLKSRFVLGNLSAGSTKTIQVPLEIEDIDSDSELSFKVSIDADNLKTRTVWHQIYVTRDISADDEILKSSLRLSHSSDGHSSMFPAINLRNDQPSPVFYTFKIIEEKGVELFLYQKQGRDFVQNGPLFLPDLHKGPSLSKSLQVFQADLDQDGRGDFMVAGLIVNEDSAFMQMSFFNDQLQPLYGSQYSQWRMPFKETLVDLQNIRFLPFFLEGVGEVQVPVFESTGILPEADYNPDPFDFEEHGAGTASEYIYFLQPELSAEEGVIARPRVINNSVFVDNLKKKMHLRDVDGYEIVGLLPQSKAQFEKGVIQGLVTGGTVVGGSHYIFELNMKTLLTRDFGLNGPILRESFVNGSTISPVIDISGTEPEYDASASLQRVYKRSQLRSIFLSPNKSFEIQKSVTFEPSNPGEIVVKYIQSFEKNGALISFIETGINTVAVIKYPNGKQTQFSRPVMRSTFLEGFHFSEIFFPTVVKRNNELQSALYIDATKITANHVMVWIVDGETEKVPMNLNIQVPEFCKSLARVRLDSSGQQAMSFLCRKDEEFQFWFLPL